MASYIEPIFIRKTQEVETQLLKYKLCKVSGFLKHEQRLYSSEITIQLNGNSELIFIKDGDILQIQKYIDYNTIQNINPNFEQLKRLFWVGQTNQNGQKIGKWNAVWRGENLNAGGFYNDDGLKIGKWVELFENYQDKVRITYQGEYNIGKKQGYWKIISIDTEIGGGEYIDGDKTGVWVDIFENYSSWCKIMERGKYKNGKKVGEWSQIYKDKIVGVGTYDDNQVKVGRWVDLHENFYDWCQVTYQGKYQNGIKKGEWKAIFQDKIIGKGNFKEGGLKDGEWVDIFKNYSIDSQITYIGQYKNGKPCKQLYISYQKDIIGGGTYNENGMKNGKWVELQDNFYDFGKVTYEGIYNNEKKEGKWQVNYNKNVIGGGLYQFGVKNGNWIDIHEHFSDTCQVSFKGEYKNGKKFKKWDIIYQHNIIGGGQYDENELKNGRWITLNENFGNLSQVTRGGQYKKGRKIGKWEIYYKDKIIGGGTYDQNGIQQGQWVELHQQFWDQQYIKFNGVYRDGIKLGFWDTIQENIKIGGGFYDIIGMKQGKWIELHQKFLKNNLLFIGSYIDSRKYGKWDAVLDQKLIGFGFYDNNGMKNENWIDLHDPFMNTGIIYYGRYNNGKKQGKWNTYFKNMMIGWGFYADNGQKNGKWIELDEDSKKNKDEIKTREIEYKNGLKQ